jgi:hypothetical protein
MELARTGNRVNPITTLATQNGRRELKTKYVEYMSEEYCRLTQTYYLEYYGHRVPYGWITWEFLELDGKKIAKMVWTRY